MPVDVPACFPTSQDLHKKTVNYISYTTFVNHAETLEIKSPTDGQTPSQVYIQELVIKGEDQMKQFIETITENVKKDLISDIQRMGTQTFITQDGSGESPPIEIDPSSCTSTGSNRPEVIEKHNFIKEIQESTGKKHALKY